MLLFLKTIIWDLNEEKIQLPKIMLLISFLCLIFLSDYNKSGISITNESFVANIDK